MLRKNTSTKAKCAFIYHSMNLVGTSYSGTVARPTSLQVPTVPISTLCFSPADDGGSLGLPGLA